MNLTSKIAIGFFLSILTQSAEAIPHKGRITLAKLPFAVILDPGHGGEDTGALKKTNGKTVSEKELTLKLALHLKAQLQKRGVPVFLTRSSDEQLPLDRRTTLANHYATLARETVFLSLHMNASHETESQGYEFFIFNGTTNEASRRLAALENGQFELNGRISNRIQTQHSTVDLILTDLKTSANFDDSKSLAATVQSEVALGFRHSRHRSKTRGIHPALFYVLMQTEMPGFLLEAGFLSNSEEAHFLSNEKYLLSMARSISQGVLKYRGQQISKSLQAAN